MTWREWRCMKCGHTMPVVQIQDFVPECPKCKAKYMLVGYFGEEMRVTIPIECPVGDWPSKAGEILEGFDRSNSFSDVIVCRDEETAAIVRKHVKNLKVKVDQRFYDWILRNHVCSKRMMELSLKPISPSS